MCTEGNSLPAGEASLHNSGAQGKLQAGDPTGTQEFLGGAKASVVGFTLSPSSPSNSRNMLGVRWGVAKAYTAPAHLAVLHSFIAFKARRDIT